MYGRTHACKPVGQPFRAHVRNADSLKQLTSRQSTIRLRTSCSSAFRPQGLPSVLSLRLHIQKASLIPALNKIAFIMSLCFAPRLMGNDRLFSDVSSRYVFATLRSSSG